VNTPLAKTTLRDAGDFVAVVSCYLPVLVGRGVCKRDTVAESLVMTW